MIQDKNSIVGPLFSTHCMITAAKTLPPKRTAASSRETLSSRQERCGNRQRGMSHSKIVLDN
jgi:hypothetical protein